MDLGNPFKIFSKRNKSKYLPSTSKQTISVDTFKPISYLDINKTISNEPYNLLISNDSVASSNSTFDNDTHNNSNDTSKKDTTVTRINKDDNNTHDEHEFNNNPLTRRKMKFIHKRKNYDIKRNRPYREIKNILTDIIKKQSKAKVYRKHTKESHLNAKNTIVTMTNLKNCENNRNNILLQDTMENTSDIESNDDDYDGTDNNNDIKLDQETNNNSDDIMLKNDNVVVDNENSNIENETLLTNDIDNNVFDETIADDNKNIKIAVKRNDIRKFNNVLRKSNLHSLNASSINCSRRTKLLKVSRRFLRQVKNPMLTLASSVGSYMIIQRYLTPLIASTNPPAFITSIFYTAITSIAGTFIS